MHLGAKTASRKPCIGATDGRPRRMDPYTSTILWDWSEFAIRWLHVIAGIAWIGSSFYFIALDLGLNRDIPGPADGEEWQVHGGGFYHVQKYLVAPEQLPEHITWFKWEAYATWLSGAALLAVVYWAGAELYLIDQDGPVWEPWQAIAISAGSLTIGWIVYDALCKSPLGDRPTLLMFFLFSVLVGMSWGYSEVFTGRAALLHLGAFTATIMSANVFFIIIPNQRIVVADLKAGRTPDPSYGKIAKLRSTHNNYLTLPVLFLMLSGHYPLAFATDYNWIIAALVFLMGVSIRHFFNTMHARRGRPWWTWGVTALIFGAVVWLSLLGRPQSSRDAEMPDDAAETLSASAHLSLVYDVVQARCSMCHASEPLWEDLAVAPGGVELETQDQVVAHAALIYRQAAISRAMPPGNVTYMEPAERALIAAWFER